MKNPARLPFLLALFAAMLPGPMPAKTAFTPEAARTFKIEQGFIQHKPLALGALESSAHSVTQGAKWECTFPLEGNFENPFDPREIQVDLEVQTPKGSMLRVPGFFYTPCALTPEGRTVPVGSPVWKVRVTPTETGTYRYRLAAKDRSGTVQGPMGRFECVAGKMDGLIRVSRRVPTAFEYASGKGYFPVGWNLIPSWNPPDRPAIGRLGELRYGLAQLAAAGGNFIRLRADSYYLAIEGSSAEKNGFLGPGWYHQPTSWETDEVYAEAERLGIRVMHCLMEGNMVAGANPALRRFNYLLAENGGPCASSTEFWTNPEMLRQVHQRLRYVVARWGYSQANFCWEIFNEVSTRTENGHESEAILDYHRQLARTLRELDPSGRLISTSSHLRGAVADQVLWKLPELDFCQIHLYNYADPAAEYPQLACAFQAAFGKPIFFGEYGMSAENSKLADPLGIHIHNALFSTALGAGAGVANWFVGELLRQGHTNHFSVFSRWTADLPNNDPALRPLGVEETRSFPATERAVYRTVPIAPRALDPFKKMEKERFEVDPRTREVKDAEYLQKFLHGKTSRKSRPTFLLDCAAPATFVACVTRSVGDEGNALVLTLDGVETLRAPFPAGRHHGSNQSYVAQWDQWTVDYRGEVRLPLSPGKHEVRVEALAKDRLEVSYRVEGYSAAADPVACVGRGTTDRAWIWIRNQVNTDANERLGIRPEALGGASAVLTGLGAGTYRLDFEDPWEGRALPSATATTDGARLLVRTPAFTRSLLCKATRL